MTGYYVQTDPRMYLTAFATWIRTPQDLFDKLRVLQQISRIPSHLSEQNRVSMYRIERESVSTIFLSHNYVENTTEQNKIKRDDTRNVAPGDLQKLTFDQKFTCSRLTGVRASQEQRKGCRQAGPQPERARELLFALCPGSGPQPALPCPFHRV